MMTGNPSAPRSFQTAQGRRYRSLATAGGGSEALSVDLFPHLLVAPARMAAVDRATIAAGTPGVVLMDRAGAAVAEAARAALCERRRDGTGGDVLVLAGPGNNGGDGFVAAARLARAGHRVQVALLGARASLSGDAAWAAQQWSGPVMALDADATLAALDRADLVIDALFGAGLSRPLDGVVAAVVRAVNASAAPVLAVDMPSGVDGATGRIRGVAVEAAATVTFERLKPGHRLFPGAQLAGRLICRPIGLDPAALAAEAEPLADNHADLWRAAWPAADPTDHKYAQGHAVVVGGAAPGLGAGRLAALAALRAGAGLVSLATPEDGYAIQAAALAEVMVAPVADDAALEAFLDDPRKAALVFGPGAPADAATRGRALRLLALGRPLVLDAGALTAFAGDVGALARAVCGPLVLTPHEGEFGRLFGADGAAEATKVDRARTAAARTGAVVLLKGADTVIAGPDGVAVVDSEALPRLATAGSGDVLAGLIAGLLARGLAPMAAAGVAVRMQRLAAHRAGHGLIAGDLVDALPGVRQGWPGGPI